MKFILNNILIFFLSLLVITIPSNSVKAADVIDSIEEEDRVETDAQASTGQAPNLLNESIKNISPSKKIFIITNDNQGFSRGDYISLLIGNQLVCRALVAKTTSEKLGGIKIVKIYNMELWSKLGPKKEVLVLKGDDSYYNVKEKVAATPNKKDKKESDSKIENEEDLFNSTTSINDDDQSFEENSKRLIKPDNLLGIKYSLLSSQDNSGSATKYTHIAADWGYQVADNIWGEVGVGTNTIRDYPNANGLGGLDTQLISMSLRFKYTINAPFYSYVVPYVGYQIVNASSPSAGQQDTTSPQTEATLKKELALVDDLKKSGPVFGITVLRRIVPGWFARVDLGSDLIGGGISLEF